MKYAVIVAFLIFSSFCSTAQNVLVIHYNTFFNTDNTIIWLDSLQGSEVIMVQINSDKTLKTANKNGIKRYPTIVIYKNDKEMYRFEADIMMKLNIPKDTIQYYINKLISF